ncbi:MAG: Trm112 family protein [Burkholderiaceae bacterium]|nr:Trm112 family protein [Burkholderiaceae bacterium]
MDSHITQILVCPICKGPLFWDEQKKEFYCRSDMKAYAVIDSIPSMVPSEARDLTEEEIIEKDNRRK